jgi:hypothetical protein
MTQVVWLSVDPVRRKIDFYPRAFASRIEKRFKQYSFQIEQQKNAQIGRMGA